MTNRETAIIRGLDINTHTGLSISEELKEQYSSLPSDSQKNLFIVDLITNKDGSFLYISQELQKITKDTDPAEHTSILFKRSCMEILLPLIADLNPDINPKLCLMVYELNIMKLPQEVISLIDEVTADKLEQLEIRVTLIRRLTIYALNNEDPFGETPVL